MTTTTTRPATDARWMIRRDIPRVLDIQAQTQHWRADGAAWCEVDYLNTLRQRKCLGFVGGTWVKEPHDIISISELRPDGFAVLTLEATHVHLLRFAALPGTGAGAALARKLFDKMQTHRKRHVYYSTPDGPGALWDRMPEVRPEWMTADVRAMLAAPRPPEWCGVLADALQDAGCDDDGLLSDLREDGIGQLVWQWLAD